LIKIKYVVKISFSQKKFVVKIRVNKSFVINYMSLLHCKKDIIDNIKSFEYWIYYIVENSNNIYIYHFEYNKIFSDTYL